MELSAQLIPSEETIILYVRPNGTVRAVLPTGLGTREYKTQRTATRAVNAWHYQRHLTRSRQLGQEFSPYTTHYDWKH